MQKRNRFSFWRVGAWLIGINLFIIGFVLVIVYFVKMPNQPKYLGDSFHSSRFLLRMGFSPGLSMHLLLFRP